MNPPHFLFFRNKDTGHISVFILADLFYIFKKKTEYDFAILLTEQNIVILFGCLSIFLIFHDEQEFAFRF